MPPNAKPAANDGMLPGIQTNFEEAV